MSKGRRILPLLALVAGWAAVPPTSPAPAPAPHSFEGPHQATDRLAPLRDLARDVSDGLRDPGDMRLLALEIIEPSAYAMRAVNGAGLGAHSSSGKVTPWLVVGLYGTGQSLSTAYDATPCLSTSQPFANVYVCDSTGNYPWNSGPTSGSQYSWVPFDCGVTCGGSAGVRFNANNGSGLFYPENITTAGELNTFSFANTRTWLALTDGYAAYTISSSDIGIGGQSISALIKGGSENAYAAGLFEIAVNTALTKEVISAAVVGSPTVVTTSAAHHLTSGNKVYITGAAGMTELNGYFAATVIDATRYSVPVASTHTYTGSGVATSYGIRWGILTHGETDGAGCVSISNYTSPTGGFLNIVNNLQIDGPAITGQTESIDWIASQQSSTFCGPSLLPPSTMVNGNSTAQALFTLLTTPHVFVTGPKYQLPYCTNCGPHISNVGQRLLGEKYGEVADIIDRTGTWTPLTATTASVSGGTTVVLTYHVPVGCLSFSGTLAPPHQSGVLAAVWSNGKGYEPYDLTGLVISGATNANPIVYTTTTSNTGKISNGDTVCVGGEGFVTGNTNATQCGPATIVDSTHFSISGLAGNGAYSSQFGTVQVMDLLPVTSATISSCDQVTVVLGRAAATQLKMATADAADSYFDTGGSGQAGCGAGGGMCALLQDGDTFAATYSGASGTAQPNYVVTLQDQSIPF